MINAATTPTGGITQAVAVTATATTARIASPLFESMASDDLDFDLRPFARDSISGSGAEGTPSGS